MTTLKAAARVKFSDATKGKVLIGSSSGGTAVQYSLPSLGDLTAYDLGQVYSAIREAAEELIAATPLITDAALKAALLERFKSKFCLRQDFSTGLRR